MMIAGGISARAERSWDPPSPQTLQEQHKEDGVLIKIRVTRKSIDQDTSHL